MSSFDSVSFLGSRIPKEIHHFLNFSQVTPLSIQKNTLKLVNAFVFKQIGEEKQRLGVKKLKDEIVKDQEKNINGWGKILKIKSVYHKIVGLKERQFEILFNGFYLVLTSAWRQRMKVRDFEEQCELLFKDFRTEIIPVVNRVFKDGRSPFVEMMQSEKDWFPRMSNVRWRVDVTISNSSMNRVFHPVLLMQFQLSDGKLKTFEMNIKTFHQLRLNVAQILNEINRVHSNPIMKVEI